MGQMCMTFYAGFGLFLFIWHRFRNFHWIPFIRNAFIVIVHCYECDCKYDWCGSMLSVQKKTQWKSYSTLFGHSKCQKSNGAVRKMLAAHNTHYPVSTTLLSVAQNRMKTLLFSLSKYTLVSSHCVYAETKPISSPQRVHCTIMVSHNGMSHHIGKRHVTINEDEWDGTSSSILYYRIFLASYQIWKRGWWRLVNKPRWHQNAGQYFFFVWINPNAKSAAESVVMRQSDFGWRKKFNSGWISFMLRQWNNNNEHRDPLDMERSIKVNPRTLRLSLIFFLSGSPKYM